MIKVFALIGSAAGEQSVTAKLSDQLAEAFRRRAAQDGEQVEYERLTGADLRVDYCRSCQTCFEKGFCPRDEFDDMGMLRKKILECDVLFFASPVYYGRMSGFTKCVLDRLTYMSHTLELIGKPMLQFMTTYSNHGTEASEDLEYLLRFFCGALVNAGAFYAVGHPNLEDKAKMEEVMKESADRLMRAYLDPRTAVTDSQQQAFLARVILTRRLIRKGKGEKGEVKAVHEKGLDRYVLLSEALEEFCMNKNKPSRSEQQTAPNPLRENEEGLFGVQWHITDNCDQRCRHCYIFAEDNHKPPVNMDYDQMREVMGKVDAFLSKMDMRPNWHITGGDPLMNPDFWMLAEYMKEKQLPYLLMGNPFHLTPEVCRRLKDTGCQAFQLSIDGTEETHDWFRKPGSFRKTLDVIPMLHAAGIESVVSMTVSELNYRQLPDVMDIVEKARVGQFGFSRYVPTSGEKTNAIDPMEYRALLDTYFKKRQEARRRGSFTYFTLKDHLLALYLYEEGKFHPTAYCHKPGDHMPAGCHCANGTMAITADGTVMACRRMESSALGNIFTDDLMEMWTEAKTRYRQYDRFADCARCRLEPWCRGCPAISAAVSGDYYGRDPQCWRVIEE